MSSSSWLGTWARRIKLTIDAGDVTAGLTDFPVLIHLSSSCGAASQDLTPVFDMLGANRKKIAVTLSDALTQCYVEVEEWDAAGEEAWLWCKVPAIDATVDTELYLYYDPAKADNTTYVGDPNSVAAENVWEASAVFVSHMRDDPDTSHIRDSSTNDNDGTKKAANEPIVTTAGRISDAQSFDGGNDYLVLPVIRTALGAAFTILCWIKRSGFGSNDWVVDLRDAGFLGPVFAVTDIDDLRCDLQDSLGNYFSYNYATTIDTDWHLIGCQYSSPNINIIYDGAIVGTSNVGAFGLWVGAGGESVVGAQVNGHDRNFAGIIDEPRIYSDARSMAEVLADYESGRDHFLVFGGVEEYLAAAHWVSCPLCGAVAAVEKIGAVGVLNVPDSSAFFCGFCQHRWHVKGGEDWREGLRSKGL